MRTLFPDKPTLNLLGQAHSSTMYIYVSLMCQCAGLSFFVFFGVVLGNVGKCWEMLGKHGNAKLNAKGVVMHCDTMQ